MNGRERTDGSLEPAMPTRACGEQARKRDQSAGPKAGQLENRLLDSRMNGTFLPSCQGSFTGQVRREVAVCKGRSIQWQGRARPPAPRASHSGEGAEGRALVVGTMHKRGESNA